MEKPILYSQPLVDISRMFCANRVLSFKRKTSNYFYLPIFNPPSAFLVPFMCAGSSVMVKIIPISFTIKTKKPVSSMLDLMTAKTEVDQAFFSCYYDSATHLNIEYPVRLKAGIIAPSPEGLEYLLHCRIHSSRYSRLYRYSVGALGENSHRYLNVRIENVTQVPEIFRTP